MYVGSIKKTQKKNRCSLKILNIGEENTISVREVHLNDDGGRDDPDDDDDDIYLLTLCQESC